ncbi:MAG TPA: DsbA family oxidoreductase [Dehalococcoidia bacterium]|nr:DsbA family oxidoreductase [Dehalococcoidia bacterium]
MTVESRVAQKLEVTVVSDYVCPWCFIGLTRIEQLERDYDVTVEWVPYELRPGTPPQGIPFERLRGRPPYTDDYLLNLSVLADKAGIAMAERQFVPNSLPSLKAAEWAREAGVFPLLHRALFQAYFEEGRDIGDLEVLRDIAASLGLDAADMVESIVAGRFDERLEEKLEWSRVAGQGGVPRFIFKATYEDGSVKRAGFAGAQDYEVFQQFMRRLGARPRKGQSP